MANRFTGMNNLKKIRINLLGGFIELRLQAFVHLEHDFLFFIPPGDVALDVLVRPFFDAYAGDLAVKLEAVSVWPNAKGLVRAAGPLGQERPVFGNLKHVLMPLEDLEFTR